MMPVVFAYSGKDYRAATGRAIFGIQPTTQ